MSSDIKMWDDEIQEALEWLENILNGMAKVKETERPKKLDQCEAKIAEVKSLLKSFSIELRHVSEPALQKDYKDRKTEYGERLTTFTTKIKFYRGGEDRTNLMAGATEKKDKDFKKMNSDELIGTSIKTQTDTTDALKRIQAAAADAKDIGLATGAELLRQSEQMNKIGEDLTEIDGELDRSNKLIRAFGIRMMTDRCMQIFMFLLVAGIATIIILSAVLPKGSTPFSVPDVVQPPAQVTSLLTNGGGKSLR